MRVRWQRETWPIETSVDGALLTPRPQLLSPFFFTSLGSHTQQLKLHALAAHDCYRAGVGWAGGVHRLWLRTAVQSVKCSEEHAARDTHNRDMNVH